MKFRAVNNCFIQHHWKWTLVTKHLPSLQEDFSDSKVQKTIPSLETNPSLAYLWSPHRSLT